VAPAGSCASVILNADLGEEVEVEKHVGVGPPGGVVPPPPRHLRGQRGVGAAVEGGGTGSGQRGGG